MPHKKSTYQTKKTKKHSSNTISSVSNVSVSNVSSVSSVSDISNANFNKITKNTLPVNNSYPFGNLAYGYSVQSNKRPDDNKYFHYYKYTYNVQTNQPVMTYDNFITQNKLSNMTNQQYKYYQQFQPQYFYFNGSYDVANKKPTVLAIQANVKYPMFSGGSIVGETNSQIGYTPQPTQSPHNVNPNTVISSLNDGNIQVYGNSPAYTGVMAGELPGQNIIANRNAQQTKVNNANINNPAYFNYGQYYY